jgi:hypothetical protein
MNLDAFVHFGAWVFLDPDVPRVDRFYDSNLPDHEAGSRFVGGLQPVAFFTDGLDALKFVHEVRARIVPATLPPSGDVLVLESVFASGVRIVRDPATGEVRETRSQPASHDNVLAWICRSDLAPLALEILDNTDDDQAEKVA